MLANRGRAGRYRNAASFSQCNMARTRRRAQRLKACDGRTVGDPGTVSGHCLARQGFRSDLREAKSRAMGHSMKKTYERPVLVKREKLASIVAIVGSGRF